MSGLLTLPKVELHVHLEGSLPPHIVASLAHRHGLSLPSARGRYRDFDDFVTAWQAVTECLREPADFRLAVWALGRRAHRHRIRYLEVMFSPEPFVRRLGIPYDEILAAMNLGRREVLERFAVEMRWIVDGVRDSRTGRASVDRAVEWMLSLRGDAHGVVALGLGGRERGWPCERFVDAFHAARAAGFHLSAHAGETDGPRSVWSALEVLGAERIGHGIRAVEDPRLVAYMAERRIPVEICPTSNLRTSAVSSARAHPLVALHTAGVPITLGSDDPALFDTTLTAEFRFAARRLGLPALRGIVLQGVDGCFLPSPEKEALRLHLTAELDKWTGFCADSR